MFIYLTNYMVNLQLDFSSTMSTYQSLYTLTFFTDVGFATVGYAFGNKVIAWIDKAMNAALTQ